MAKFTRAEIRRILGDACTDEIENNLIALHIGVVDPLKDALTNAQAEAVRVEELEKEVNSLKDEKKDAEDWKAKFEKEHADFDKYKSKVDKEKANENLRGLYKNLLKEAKVDEKRFDSILKVTDLSNLKLDKDGKLEDADKISESIKTDWKDFIVSNETKGTATPETPPENSGGSKLTKKQIMDIKDTSERQKAIAENLELFE